MILGSPNQISLNCIRNNAGTSQLCTVHIQEVGEVNEAIASVLPALGNEPGCSPV
jgi:hypothetical protein